MPYDEARDPALQPALDAIRATLRPPCGRTTSTTSHGSGPTLPDGTPIPLDPVPRVLTRAQFDPLAAALIQRARVLDAYVADVHGARRAQREGVLPPGFLDDVPYVEPSSPGRLIIVGFDVARAPDGAFVVLEDNLLTPGHAAWPAARDLLPTAGLVDPPPPDHREQYRAALLGALGPDAGILGDDPPSWELEWLAAFLDVPLLTAKDQLTVRTLWQRTAEDRLQGDLQPLKLPVLREDVTLVNRPGSGVGDDKRLGARWAELTRFFLGEDPLLAPLETHDLSEPAARDRVFGAAEDWVLKPHLGAGGRDVRLPAPGDRLPDSGRWVAQRRVPLSVHPTVDGEQLAPRPVDLRLFAVHTPDGWVVPRGGVSRFAPAADAPLVNTSQGGGVKDVWVLD